MSPSLLGRKSGHLDAGAGFMGHVTQVHIGRLITQTWASLTRFALRSEMIPPTTTSTRKRMLGIILLLHYASSRGKEIVYHPELILLAPP